MLIVRSRKKVFTSSTCSVVNGPPYFNLPKLILEGILSSEYVNALRLTGCLCAAAYLSTLKTVLRGFWLTGSIISHFRLKKSRQRATDETTTVKSIDTRIVSSPLKPQHELRVITELLTALVYTAQANQWMEALISSDDAPSIWSVPNEIALTISPDDPVVTHMYAATAEMYFSASVLKGQKR